MHEAARRGHFAKEERATMKKAGLHRLFCGWPGTHPKVQMYHGLEGCQQWFIKPFRPVR